MGYRFSMEHISHQQVSYKLMSETITWDSVKKDWRIYNYFIPAW
jgi:hypothetical protein